MLVDGIAERGIQIRVVNLSGTTKDGGGRVSLQRALDYVRIIPSFIASLPWCTVVYVTIAQSRHGFFRDLIFVWLARVASKRIVCHVHGGNYGGFYEQQNRLIKLWIRSMLEQADVIVVLGEGLRAMFAFSSEVAKRVEVVPNGVATKGLLLAPKRLPSTPETPIRMLYMSNLIESKGYLDVLRAMGVLKAAGCNVVAEFYGEFQSCVDDVEVRSPDHARQLFEATIEAYGIRDRLVYGGVVDGAEKVAALMRAHVFVLPTRYCYEGQPISIIEAMAYGSVVISTNYRAIPDVIVPGATGEFVPFGSPEAIAAVVIKLAQDPALFNRMSHQAIQRYQELFTQAAHVDRMIAHLLPPAYR